MTASEEPQLFDLVRLVVDLPAEGLTAGKVGTVVEVFEHPATAYEVEFADDDGRTVAELALLPTQIERVGR